MIFEMNTTYGEGSWREQFHQCIALTEDPGQENHVINIYPEFTGQTIEGFGGAITDSAGFIYSQLDDRQKKELLETYFSPKRMNYQMIRVHMDSCDFSVDQYEALDDPEDLKLEGFSMERTEKYILPMLYDAEKYAGRKLRLMLSPWSPPAFMKTNGERNHGGSLKKEYRKFWSEYLCRYIQEFRKRGFIVERISLQNEPKAVQEGDSCIFTSEEEKEFLRDYMYPSMKEHHLDDIEIFLWDHNKERVYEWMRDIIDHETDGMVAGAAFHWYSGDHFEALDLCKKRFPEKKLIVSESCIELNKFGAGENINNAMRLAHEMIGDLNHGICAFYDWNMLLNEEGGPNHVDNNCLAPFMYDRSRKKLIPQLIAQYFEHITKNIIPGSVHLAVSRFSEDIDVTAFKRPDEKIVIILLNRSEKPQPICIRMNNMLAEAILLPKSISSGCCSFTE